ncbi:hypothetical protein B0J13DRAFT_552039 [Dactylonectria estremocensis]|uniref:Uncharacterized protein n=1 Tax=Dactylonectria estremocensis TaxID=1079267 RepID=A0A9P9F147_9HYPO|nr:hypothetical protein B0J13DRAFT_552039 [Dactylonectria estremocensis]
MAAALGRPHAQLLLLAPLLNLSRGQPGHHSVGSLPRGSWDGWWSSCRHITPRSSTTAAPTPLPYPSLPRPVHPIRRGVAVRAKEHQGLSLRRRMREMGCQKEHDIGERTMVRRSIEYGTRDRRGGQLEQGQGREARRIPAMRQA